MRSRPSLFAIGALVALGCAPSGSTPAADEAPAVRQAIESANAQFLTAVQSGDTVAVLANYAPDAVVMMAGEPPWRGQDGIRAGFKGLMDAYKVTDGGLKTQDVIMSGDVAVETGTYEWKLQPKRGKAVDDHGRYVTVWQRQADGSWKVVRDITHPDQPHDH